ncbi:unnamed protein product [Effrenium voratum]|nr:unnamed protein product [Effrenium voratum]
MLTTSFSIRRPRRQWSPLILCRVTCGLQAGGLLEHTLANDVLIRKPDSCLKKEFHCVLGDREKVRGTFREFIVFDNDQVYPEYIVWYEREF